MVCWVNRAGCVFALPIVSGGAFQPDAAEPCVGSRTPGVDAHPKILTRRYAARRLVCRAARKRAAAGDIRGLCGEGDEIEAEQVLQSRLKLFNLGVEFEEQAGF